MVVGLVVAPRYLIVQSNSVYTFDHSYELLSWPEWHSFSFLQLGLGFDIYTLYQFGDVAKVLSTRELNFLALVISLDVVDLEV